MSKKCHVCDKSIGALNIFKYTTKDGYVLCKNCIRSYGFGLSVSYSDINKRTLERVQNHQYEVENNIVAVDDKLISFQEDRILGNSIKIDLTNRVFTTSLYSNTKYYFIDNITGYEIVENGKSVSSGGLGKATAGAIAFGGFGAVVGALSGKKQTEYIDSLKIKINMNTLDCPVVYIDIIKSKIKKSSSSYTKAIARSNEILSSLDIILSENNKVTETNNSIPNYDELKELKSLLDTGIITTEEFETKKKQILNI